MKQIFIMLLCFGCFVSAKSQNSKTASAGTEVQTGKASSDTLTQTATFSEKPGYITPGSTEQTDKKKSASVPGVSFTPEPSHIKPETKSGNKKKESPK